MASKGQLVALWVVSATMASCDGASRGNGDSDGPRIFEASDVHVLGTSESIATILDLDVLSDGSVWALNSIEPFFVGFGPDGAALGEHGYAGGGPEEVGRAVGLVTGGIGGEAWALDEGRHTLVRISRPGEPWAQISLPPDSIPPATLIGGRDPSFVRVRAARLADEVVVPRTTLAPDAGWTSIWLGIWGADLLAVDPEGGTARHVVRLFDVLGDPRPSAPPTPEFLPFPPWFRLWTVCADSEIRVHDRLGNQIRGFRPDGTELTPVSLPDPALTSVSREEFAIATLEAAAVESAGSLSLEPPRMDTAALLARMRPRIEGDASELAALLPRYTDLHCTEDGVLWTRPFDIEIGGLRGGPRWLRIAPDGEAREVVLPPRFDPLRFTSDRIWGAQRDELDVASVAWIEW